MLFKYMLHPHYLHCKQYLIIQISDLYTNENTRRRIVTLVDDGQPIQLKLWGEKVNMFSKTH